MKEQKHKISGAKIFFECLRNENVEYIFGYPGGVVLKIYEELYDVDFLTHILARHEQGATHMAEGYAKATGKVGVVLVTSGPGATNTVTGIADAYMDSVPLVVFTGQVATRLIGNDAFQEADIIGITRPITKHNFLVRDVNDMAETIKKAFYIASTGRPGPVVVDLPKDVINSVAEFRYPDKVEIRGYKPTLLGHMNQIKAAAKAISKAKRPLLYVGGGVIIADATKELYMLAKRNNIPVTMTLLGLGAFPGNEVNSLGMLGMHGTYTANKAVDACDCLVALGARFDDRVTGKTDSFSTKSFKIHVDIDPTAIDKNIVVDLPIVGDVKHVLTELLNELTEAPETDEWWKEITHWQKDCPLQYESSDGKLRTEYILERLSEKTNGEAVIVTDVGQHQMWTAQHYKFVHPRSMITSGGLGTMGFGLPAAIGAQFAVKDRPIVCISGDGGFQMNIQELITAAAHKLPIKFFIMNNGFLGMVRQWQELFHAEKYSFTDLSQSNPDFVKVATAFGLDAFCVDKVEDVNATLDKVFAIKDKPTLIEFKVERSDMVFPMVPAGGTVAEIMTKRLNPKLMV